MGKKKKNHTKFVYVFAQQILTYIKNARKGFWRIRRMHVKNFGVNGAYMKHGNILCLSREGTKRISA